MLTLQNLHLGKQVAEVFGVLPDTSAALHPFHVRYGDACSLEHVPDLLTPWSLERRRIRRELALREALLEFVGVKEFSGVPPEIVHGILQPAMALVGAAAELQHPIAAVANVIARLLEHLCRDASEILVGAPLQRLCLCHRVDAEQELPSDGEGEVAFGKLDEQRVSVVDAVTQKREGVGVAIGVLGRRGVREQEIRLAYEIEGDVRERDVLLENRRMAAPFGQTMAEHQAIVAETHEVLDEVGNRGSLAAARDDSGHIRTPFGTL